MPDSDRVSIDNLTLAPDLDNNDVAPVVHTVNGVKSTYKATMTLLGTFLNKILEYSADLTTTNKTIIGAINEINAGGGGGGAVILYGTTAPASSLGSDGNLYVKYTAGTGGASDVVDALYVKLDGEWCEISTKQVQSDWSQADNTKVDYIKNKPDFSRTDIKSQVTFNETITGTNTQVYVKMGVLYIYYQGENKTHNATDLLFTLPAAYKPTNMTYCTFNINDVAYGEVGIENTGKCFINHISTAGASGRVYFAVAIPLN